MTIPATRKREINIIMKFVDEYRDPALARTLLSIIAKKAALLKSPVTMMEVCGTHTHAIGRFGIRQLIPSNIRLVSGPGCPVCVTSMLDVDRALYLANLPGVTFATFGDMMRVPGSGGRSLQKSKANGADVRLISSSYDIISLTEENPGKEVIMMGIGFETTAPTIAAVIETAKKMKIRNLSVFSVHKIIPPAMQALLEDQTLNIKGFICPGHVSTIIGADSYRIIPETGGAAVITGFEPIDILEGIIMILDQIIEKKYKVAIQYVRGVKPEGNPRAQEIMNKVFQIGDADWRGIGNIPLSGLHFRDEYGEFDALNKFSIPALQPEEFKGCRCGDILRGVILPDQCPLFRRECTPLNPVGACMVSSEGTCSAYYKYHPTRFV